MKVDSRERGGGSTGCSAGASSCESSHNKHSHRNLEGLVCVCAALLLLPLLTYAIGLWGLLALYFCCMAGIALLYGAQIFLTRPSRRRDYDYPKDASLARPPTGHTLHSLAGRHVLITGGSKGIGLSLAVEAVKRNAALVSLVARETGGLEAAQSACLQIADELGIAVSVQIISADIEDSKAAIECLERATKLKGHTKRSAACGGNWSLDQQEEAPIEVFFCNAAYVDPRPFCCASNSDICRSVGLNLCTPLLQVKQVLPSMIERGFGVICFSNSLATFVPIYGFAGYSATKSALRAFAEALNQEVAGTGVLVSNTYMPSVDTPGYNREKRVRHKITEIFEGMTKMRQPGEVAERIINGLEGGHRTITFDFDGWALARLNAGFSRAESFASLVYEFLLGGVFRVFTLGLFLQYYHIIAREQPAALRRAKAA